MNLLAGRPAIRIVIALWATFAVLLAVNLTIRLSPHEVRFVRQSPPSASPSAQPTPAPPVPIVVEAPPKAAPVLPQPRRAADIQRTRAPAAPSPVQRSKTTPAPIVVEQPRREPIEVVKEEQAVEEEGLTPIDPCLAGCDDPVPPDESSGGGEDTDPVVEQPSEPEPIEEPAGSSDDSAAQ